MKVLKSNDIHIQNDFEDELVENPRAIESYSKNPSERYNTLFRMGVYAIHGYKIFDYLLLNTAFNDSVGIFELDLVNNGLFNSYVDDVLSRDDEFLKAYMRVYFEIDDMDEVYGDKKNIVDIFINDTKYSPNYRLNGIMGLCEYKLPKNTINYIKENVVDILSNIEELKEISEEQRQSIINNYLDSIDQYQRDCDMYNR